MNKSARIIRSMMMGIGIFLLLLCISLTTWLLGEEEYKRITSPNGHYLAIATYKRYQLFIPSMPGQSSDKDGFIDIYGTDGTEYGRYPVLMVAVIHDLCWEETGAYVPAFCQWNFKTKTIRYWNESQTEETIIQMD